MFVIDLEKKKMRDRFKVSGNKREFARVRSAVFPSLEVKDN